MTLLLVVGAVVLLSFVAVVVLLDAARRRPMTTMDLYCAALDEHLAATADEPGRRRARTVHVEDRRGRRSAGSAAGGGARSPRVAL